MGIFLLALPMDSSHSIAPKAEHGPFGELESHQEKILTVHFFLYQSVDPVRENTMVYLFVHQF